MGCSRYDGQQSCSISEIPFFLPTLQQNGEQYVSTLHHFEWILPEGTASPYLSVCRSFKTVGSNQAIGIVEAAQESSKIFQFLDNYPEYSDIFIYNTNEECIYPITPLKEEYQYYYYNLQINKYQPGIMYEISDFSHPDIPLLMTYSIDPFLDTVVIVLQPKTVIWNSLDGFFKVYTRVFLLILMVAFVFTFSISRRLTTSLRILSEALENLNLQKVQNVPLASPFTNARCHYREIFQLQNAYTHMYYKLGHSINETLSLKESEVTSRMQAMQAQMNPHFLYNNISTIAAMAEEGMNEQIVTMCCQLSGMMRYVVSDLYQRVPFSAERQFTMEYWGCLQIRHGNAISLQWDVPEELDEILIPKLVLQPIVENSIKYCSDELNLKISITGHIQDNHWTVSISDTGPGFDPMIRNAIFEAIEVFRETHMLPSLQISGLALLNIFARLFLLYKDETIFNIENNKPHGSLVIIGGLLHVASPDPKGGESK